MGRLRISPRGSPMAEALAQQALERGRAAVQAGRGAAAGGGAAGRLGGDGGKA
jgi:hypothetical protein